MDIKEIAKTCKDAQNLYENGQIKDLEEACEVSCVQNKLPVILARLIYLAIDSYPNDVDVWIEDVLLG